MKVPSRIPVAKRNNDVFSLLWNCPSAVDDGCKVGGRSFQTRGPETAELHVHTLLFSFWAPSDLHVLLNEDSDGQCWQQPKCVLQLFCPILYTLTLLLPLGYV